jgi:hypothetical protein
MNYFRQPKRHLVTWSSVIFDPVNPILQAQKSPVQQGIPHGTGPFRLSRFRSWRLNFSPIFQHVLLQVGQLGLVGDHSAADIPNRLPSPVSEFDAGSIAHAARARGEGHDGVCSGNFDVDPRPSAPQLRAMILFRLRRRVPDVVRRLWRYLATGFGQYQHL